MQLDIAPDIATLKADAIAIIDSTSGRVRGAYLTVIPGQAATYDYKLRDCQAYLAATNPVLADYPWVAAEAEAQDKTPTAAAQFVVATYQQWQAIGVGIEKARLTAKNAIRAATTVPAVAGARNQGKADLEAFLP